MKKKKQIKVLISQNQAIVEDFELYVRYRAVMDTKLSAANLLKIINKYTTLPNASSERYLRTGGKNERTIHHLINSPEDALVAWYLHKVGVIFCSDKSDRKHLVAIPNSPALLNKSDFSFDARSLISILFRTALLASAPAKYFQLSVNKMLITAPLVQMQLEDLIIWYNRQLLRYNYAPAYLSLCSALHWITVHGKEALLADNLKDLLPAMSLKGIEKFGSLINFRDLEEVWAVLRMENLLVGYDVKELIAWEGVYYPWLEKVIGEHCVLVDYDAFVVNVAMYDTPPRPRAQSLRGHDYVAYPLPIVSSTTIIAAHGAPDMHIFERVQLSDGRERWLSEAQPTIHEILLAQREPLIVKFTQRMLDFIPELQDHVYRQNLRIVEPGHSLNSEDDYKMYMEQRIDNWTMKTSGLMAELTLDKPLPEHVPADLLDVREGVFTYRVSPATLVDPAFAYHFCAEDETSLQLTKPITTHHFDLPAELEMSGKFTNTDLSFPSEIKQRICRLVEAFGFIKNRRWMTPEEAKEMLASGKNVPIYWDRLFLGNGTLRNTTGGCEEDVLSRISTLGLAHVLGLVGYVTKDTSVISDRPSDCHTVLLKHALAAFNSAMRFASGDASSINMFGIKLEGSVSAPQIDLIRELTTIYMELLEPIHTAVSPKLIPMTRFQYEDLIDTDDYFTGLSDILNFVIFLWSGTTGENRLSCDMPNSEFLRHEMYKWLS